MVARQASLLRTASGLLMLLARPGGLEPPTHSLEVARELNIFSAVFQNALVGRGRWHTALAVLEKVPFSKTGVAPESSGSSMLRSGLALLLGTILL